MQIYSIDLAALCTFYHTSQAKGFLGLNVMPRSTGNTNGETEN